MSDTPETDAVDGKPTWQADIVEVGWVQSDFARRLERERDKARNAMAQAQGELDLKTLDFERMREQRDHLLKQLEAERAIADRLAALLQRNRDLYGGQQVDYQCGCSDCEYLGPIDEALAAWKESRSEV